MPTEIGERRKGCEVVELVKRPVEYKDGNIKISTTYVFVKLRCDCGKVWELPLRDYAKKRSIVDCGCGAGRTRGTAKPFRSPNMVVSAYINLDTLIRIRDFAQKKGKSVSQAVQDLCQVGLACSEDE